MSYLHWGHLWSPSYLPAFLIHKPQFYFLPRALLATAIWLIYVSAIVLHFSKETELIGYDIHTRTSAAAAAKLLQPCPTLCDPIDGSPPGSPIPGILQARTLEWVAISFSNAWKWKVKVKSLSRVWLFATPWTSAYQAPPSMGFSRQEYWSGVPSPSLIKVSLGTQLTQLTTSRYM